LRGQLKRHRGQLGFSRRVVIFEQPFHTTFGDNFFSLSFHWLKTMEREKGRERTKE